MLDENLEHYEKCRSHAKKWCPVRAVRQFDQEITNIDKPSDLKKIGKLF